MKVGELLEWGSYSRQATEATFKFADGKATVVFYDLGDFDEGKKKVESQRLSFYFWKPGDKHEVPTLEHEVELETKYKKELLQKFMRGLRKHFKGKSVQDVINFAKGAEDAGEEAVKQIINKMAREG
jgi:hypothetical protein